MPIEFRCPECMKLLRTPDGTGGQRAVCPECGRVMTVPDPVVGETGARNQDSAVGIPSGWSPGSGANPFSATAPRPAGAAPPRPSLASGSPTLDLGDILSRTWNIFKVQWLPCVLAPFLVTLVLIVAALVAVGLTVLVGVTTESEEATIFAGILAGLACVLVCVRFETALVFFFLKVAKGHSADLGDLFRGGLPFVRVAVAVVLSTIVIGLGFAFCIVPGFVFLFALSLSTLLILDRDAGVFESLSRSWELTAGNRMMLFAVWVVTVIAGMAISHLTAGLGTFVVTPFWGLMHAVIYLILTGQPTADQYPAASPATGSPVEGVVS